ncbi:hypothetical protein RSAG8_08073, partial [Rhizoctonia solani AG-8 WAC10335]
MPVYRPAVADVGTCGPWNSRHSRPVAPKPSNSSIISRSHSINIYFVFSHTTLSPSFFFFSGPASTPTYLDIHPPSMPKLGRFIHATRLLVISFLMPPLTGDFRPSSYLISPSLHLSC